MEMSYTKRYEVAISTLIPLKLCLDENHVEDFRIAHDANNYGAFDDLMLNVRHKNPENAEESKLYAIQLTHKDFPSLKKSELAKTKGKFSIKKYCDDYYRNIANFTSRRDDINREVSEGDITLCLFTNTKLKEAERIPIKSSFLSCDGKLKEESRGGFDFLNTTTHNKFYTFEVTQDDKLDDFQGKLQRRFQQLPLHSEVFENEINKSTAANVQSDYEYFVMNVIENEGVVIFKNATSFTQAIFDCFRNERVYGDKEYAKCDVGAITDEIKKNLSAEVEAGDLKILNAFFQDYFMHRYRTRMRARYSKFFRLFRFYDGQFNVENTEKKIEELVESAFGEVPPNCLKGLTKYVKQYFKENKNGGGCKFLTKDGFKLRLYRLLVGDDDDLEMGDRKYETFNETIQMGVCDRKVSLLKTIRIRFNGKEAVSLYDLTNAQDMTTKDLLRYSHEVIEMGEMLNPISHDYVKRKFYEIFVRKEVLWETRRNVFILNTRFDEDLASLFGSEQKMVHFYNSSGSFKVPKTNVLGGEPKEKRFLSMVPSTGSDEPAIQVNGENLVLVLGDHDLDECVQTLNQEKKLSCYAKHYLKVRGTNLEWCRSWGGALHLDDFLIESETVDEENLLQHFTDPLNIISAISGMGKTTVLESLMHRCPPNKLALKLNLGELSKKEISQILKDPSDYIFGKDFKSSFKRGLIQQFKNDKRILVLFVDGFDEIATEYADEFGNLFDKLGVEGLSVWLAMRPITKQHVQNINFLTLNMKGFSDQEATSYLIDKLGDVVSPLLRKIPPEFIAVPLHVSMICNIWKGEGGRPCEIDLPVLYEAFVEEKLRIYCERKYSHVINQSQTDLAAIKKEALRNHRIAALWGIYETKLLIKHGISSDYMTTMDVTKDNVGLIVSITAERPTFCHRTTAEFLAADWLAKNTRHPASREMYRVLFKPENEFTRAMFETIIVKECPFHLAVVNGDLKRVLELCLAHNHPGLDPLGRTPLHLAAVGCVANAAPDRFKILERLVEYFPAKVLAEKDSFLTRNFIDYADLVGVKLFHIAAKMGSLKFFQNVLQPNVIMTYNVNTVDEEGGFTALHWALESEQIECAEFLIRNGADVESKTKSGLTPAHFAARNGREGILSLLLSKGANPRSKDVNECTPLDSAREYNQTEWEELLIKKCKEIVSPRLV